MNQRNIAENLNDKRMLGIDEASQYVGLGRNSAKAWLVEIGAIRRFGRRVLFDKRIIDQALNAKHE